MAGALASFFTGSIRASLALPSDPENGSSFAFANFQITTEAVVFWTLVVLALLLAFLSKYADNKIDNEHKSSLNKKLHGLESMPPDAFLDEMASLYTESHNEVSQSQSNFRSVGKLSLEQIDGSIAKVIRLIAVLAHKYDGRPNCAFRAHLLLFSSSSWDQTKLGRVADIGHLSRDSQLGVLESFKSLSVTYNDAKRKLDSSEEFSFPVHKKKKGETERNVFPGPPEAYLSENGFYQCSSITTLLNDLTGDFANKNHVVTMKQFFKSEIGSFVSFAIPINKWSTTDIANISNDNDKYVAVLNIEASEEKLLENSIVFFKPVILPFLLQISDLLALRAESSN